jgi:hypothetical protein
MTTIGADAQGLVARSAQGCCRVVYDRGGVPVRAKGIGLKLIAFQLKRNSTESQYEKSENGGGTIEY